MTKVLQRILYLYDNKYPTTVIFSDGTARWNDVHGNVCYGVLTIPIESLPINPKTIWPFKWKISIDLRGNVSY